MVGTADPLCATKRNQRFDDSEKKLFLVISRSWSILSCCLSLILRHDLFAPGSLTLLQRSKSTDMLD
jgi:hypothetical protein